MTGAVDPIELEIIRHRLDAINADAGQTLVRVSGSQIASEAGDYNTALMTADGAVVACSRSIVVQSTSLNLIVTDLLSRYQANPGIRAGDQFLTNDPYLGSLHQPDVTVVAPIFAGARLIAWSGATVHEADIGGPVGGGFNHAARSIFDEPLPIAPIKIVDGGIVRADIERDYLARSRTPHLNALDLLGQIAANRASAERVAETVASYGADTLTAAMAQLIDRTEAAFRARLRDLPDGVWREIAYIQHERRIGEDYVPNAIYAVRLTMRKTGDRLLLDFTGSDDQAPGAVNCAFPALANFAMAAVLVHLCHGLAWVPGAIWRVLEIRSRPGTIVHAEWPAGVAMSTGTSAQSVRNVVSQCIARMLDASEEYANAVLASYQSTGAGGMSISGIQPDGRPFHTLFLDELTGGGGAGPHSDGNDTSGTTTSPGATPANLETNEAAFPVLYLARRELADSGGPGQQRGGVGAFWAYRPHGTQGSIALLSMAQGLQHPATLGVAGGEPGTASGLVVAEEGETLGAVDWSGVSTGARLPLPKMGLKVGLGQVLMASSQGGGGFGDPLDRDPESVRTDVVDHLVSRVGALRDFAVVLIDAGTDDDLDDVTVDAAATHALRLARRRERLGGTAPLERDWTRIGRRLSTHFESVRRGSEEEVLCAHCGKRISGVGESIHAGLILCEKGVGARFSLSERYEGSERFRIRHFYCPGCATQVDVQVAMADEPILETIASLSVPHANE
jgi:N-methylhydantoinase B